MQYNLVGGKSKGKTLADVAKLHGMTAKELTPQFKKGTQHELEHTNNLIVARKIALDHLVEFPDYYDRLDKIEKMKKGAVVETPAKLNDIVLYHEKKGNWLFAKGNFYAWLYDEDGVGKKIESGEYDFIMFPPMGKGSPFSDKYVPPLLMVWNKPYQKKFKGAEHLIGIVQGFYDEDKNEIFIDMMTTNPKYRRQGINAHLIKSVREALGVPKENVIFDKPTKEGTKFMQSGKFDNGGEIHRKHLGGDMSKHLAPNGKPSNLTHEQWHLVRTPAFKEWFGDWESDPKNASKVVDENGEPLVVHHGSIVETNFDIFDYQKADLGFHFGTKEQAKNRVESKGVLPSRKSIVNSFFLNIRVLFEMSDAGEWQYPQRYIDELISDNIIEEKVAKQKGFLSLYGREDNAIVRDYIKSKYGSSVGFVYNNKYEGKGKSFIALSPEQIKLADGSNTTFDGGNPDMRFHLGGDMSKHLAPNRKPSNLTHEQWHLVRTPEFKAWFGDWENSPETASKVVDENGEPLVVYHATRAKFNEFSIISKYNDLRNDTNWTIGSHFGNKLQAKSIAEGMDSYKVDEYFLNIRNLERVYDYQTWTKKEWQKNLIQLGYIKEKKTDYTFNEIWDVIQKNKLDGFLYKNRYEGGGDSYVVLNANQIKLADGTNTTFDGNNPDIRFDKGGEIENLIDQGEIELKVYPTTPKHANLYGLKSENPLYIQTIFISENQRLKGIGKKVLKYLNDFAIENGHDVMFGHITQKASFSKDDSRESNLDDVAMIKNWLQSNGYEICEGNNDFYKVVNNPDIRFAKGGEIHRKHLGGDMSKHLAPNGKPSNLTHEQWHLVRTPEFKAWFGDWENDPENSSKVVDENGEPLVVYHGTTSDLFYVFDLTYFGKTDKGFFGEGFYFTQSKGTAETYASISEWDKINSSFNEKGRVLSCFLKLLTPIIVTTKMDFINASGKREIREGYDGKIIIPNTLHSPNTEFIAFESNQIKLSDGTNTTFDGNNPDIRFAKGGTLDFSSSKSLSIKIDNDIYKIQYQKDELGSESNPSEKKVWFAKVITKNGKQVEGRLCYADDYVAVIYGFNLDEIKDGIMHYYQSNDLYLILQDELGKVIETRHIENDNSNIRFAKGGENLTNKELMASDLVNEQKKLQRNSKYAILLDATWSNYTNEMREVNRNLEDEVIKKLGYNPLVNYYPFSDKVILMFDDDSNLIGALEFTIKPQYTEVPRYSPDYVKPEPIFENNNNVFFIEYLFSFAKGNGQKIMNKLKQYAHKYNVDIGLYGSIVYREDQEKPMASAKHLRRFYDKQGFVNVKGHYFLYSPNSMAKGGRTIAQTPAPASDRKYGSKVNPKGSASDTQLAKSIKFNNNLEKAIENKVEAYNEKHRKDEVGLPTAKAVVRRGMGAYSKSHRPTISGGAPNSRQAWGLARLNKFLLKKSGEKVKSAYIQDDDLLKYANGGQLESEIKANAYLVPSNCTDISDVDYALDSLRELDAKYGSDNPKLLKLWAKMLERKKYLESNNS
jgi:GNAT superfamily N-acetyltransferase